jgi:hypothetical protein
MLSIDTTSIAALEGMMWQPFRGVGQDIFSLLGVKPKGKKLKGKGKEEKEAEFDMVSTISFIQANMQHSMAASRIITRTVSIKGIDVALIQELWYHEDCIKDLKIPGYILYFAGGTDRPTACILVRNMIS